MSGGGCGTRVVEMMDQEQWFTWIASGAGGLDHE